MKKFILIPLLLIFITGCYSKSIDISELESINVCDESFDLKDYIIKDSDGNTFDEDSLSEDIYNQCNIDSTLEELDNRLYEAIDACENFRESGYETLKECMQENF